MAPVKKRNRAVKRIAKAHGIDTLEDRKSDGLDFHDIAVWDIKSMLDDAYFAGKAAGKSAAARAAE